MLVELFFEPLFIGDAILNKISGFRHSRSPKCKTQPNYANVFEIKKEDFYRLISALDHQSILGTEDDNDFSSGTLFIKTIDNKKGNIDKGGFISSL